MKTGNIGILRDPSSPPSVEIEVGDRVIVEYVESFSDPLLRIFGLKVLPLLYSSSLETLWYPVNQDRICVLPISVLLRTPVYTSSRV